MPARNQVFRFNVGRDPDSTLRDGERFTEITPLPAYLAPARDVPEGEQPPPDFGTLVSVDGMLYAVSGDRVACYGSVGAGR